MTTVTAYKVLQQKGTKYLMYLRLYKFWFIKWYAWECIPYPNEKGLPQVVCNKITKYKELKKFILEYLDVEDYFKKEYVERKNKFKKGNFK
jgi:hypothetical protein